MDTRKIRKLIELVKETGIGELEVKSGEESVRISCQPAHAMPVAAPLHTLPMMAAETVTAPAATASPPESAPPVTTSTAADGHTVLSPMVGTVYLAPASGSMPFVQVGDRVNAGDTLCLIEAMKMFNKIEADVTGVVSARRIDNEQPVEYGQALFIIESVE